MANIKTTPEQWAEAKEYFEAGLSLSAIVAKTGISKTQLSKRSGLEGWAKGTEKEQLIVDAVRVGLAKGTLTEQALAVHNEIVDERVMRVEWLNVQALKNVKGAMAHPCDNQNDYRARADTISKAKEVVVGRQPETAIQINNNAQPTITHDEFRETARALITEV
jgi:hypothetical protein